MKLNVEIKNDEFKYDYEIGSSKQNGTMTLNSENLVAFVKAVDICAHSHARSVESRMEELMIKAAIEEKKSKDVPPSK